MNNIENTTDLIVLNFLKKDPRFFTILNNVNRCFYCGNKHMHVYRHMWITWFEGGERKKYFGIAGYCNKCFGGVYIDETNKLKYLSPNVDATYWFDQAIILGSLVYLNALVADKFKEPENNKQYKYYAEL